MTAPANFSEPLLFPPSGDGQEERTALVLAPDGDHLPRIVWIGAAADAAEVDAAADMAAVNGRNAGTPLLVEHSRGSYRRPSLRGYRAVRATTDEAISVGRDWSPSFALTAVRVAADRLVVDAADGVAALALRTEIEALPGGPLRIRHRLTNHGGTTYVVEGLEVPVPVAGAFTEAMDFTGRHERERSVQRHPIRDGLWLREGRRGRTGLETAGMLIAGTPGFGFGAGAVIGVHVGFSGNSVYGLERGPEAAAMLSAGELLLPGELALEPGEPYETPWIYVTASANGLDSLAAQLHRWQRTLPSHPRRQPVLLNVWEAVYFDHDLARLCNLADRAARIGVKRFVLDDGWFRNRRDDDAGLGDWEVDPTVWPDGLHPLVDHVRSLGMQFGLWVEPEMVNPESQLYRAHPDWILATGNRVPPLSRHQLVLDLTNPEVTRYLTDRLDALLSEYAVDYVKWDHNRDLLDAGSGPGGRPAAHRQALAHYELLDGLQRRHPAVDWESCAAGGGRIDLGVLPRVQRFWTSDMTDALSRQAIQRWTTQLVAPEYLGAHVSAPQSHQTGRTLSLDFRAATALFGSFGIEWDLTAAADTELDRLAEWIDRYHRLAPLLHNGRVVRVESSDPAVLLHGVVSADRRSALLAHVQMDESQTNRGVRMPVPGLLDDVRYRLRWEGPTDTHRVSQAPPIDPDGPTGCRAVSGLVLRTQGIWFPRRRPESILLTALEAET